MDKTEVLIGDQGENVLFSDVCGIIDNARKHIAVYVNSEICLTKWYVGRRIKEDVLYNQRAEYGKQIVKNLALKLTEKYGNGWSDRSLLHCIACVYFHRRGNCIRSAETIHMDAYSVADVR